MDLRRFAAAAAWLAALASVSACGPAPVFERLSERLLDRIDSARLLWETKGSARGGLELSEAEDGLVVSAPLEADERWKPVAESEGWLAERAGDLVVWSFPAALPTSDPDTIRLEAVRRELPEWRRPGDAPPFGWFYSTGGFLARGFYLALPEGAEPSSLGLRVLFAPSRRFLIDLTGGEGPPSKPEELVGWIERGGVHRRALTIPGRASLEFPVRIPARARLRFDGARRELPWVAEAEASRLAVEWREGGDWRSLGEIRFPGQERSGGGGAWHPVDLDLSRLEGRSVELRFRVADAAAVGRLTHYVADPVIVAPGSPPKLRNLLVVIVDGLRADRIGRVGAESGTPNLDRLARRGLRFSNVSTAAPWTRASVASLLTGRLPSAHGVETEDVGARLPKSFPVLTEELRRRGFATAAFSANPHLDPGFGLARGFSRVESRLVDGALLERRMSEWLERPENEPFFLFGFFMDTHFPYQDHAEDGAAEAIAAEVVNPQRLGRGVDRERRGLEDPSPEEVRKLEALYDENVRYADAQIGALLDRLEARGVADDTVVAVLADHGEAFGEHGDYFHGWNLYRELEHVPLVIAGPGVPRGVRDASTSLVDLPALLLELVGLEDGPLADPKLARDLLSGRGGGPPPVLETRFRRTDFAAIVEWPWKLILGRRQGNVELYDLERDPAEKTDRAAEEPRRAERMKRDLLERLEAARAERVEELEEPDEDLGDTMAELRALGYL